MSAQLPAGFTLDQPGPAAPPSSDTGATLPSAGAPAGTSLPPGFTLDQPDPNQPRTVAQLQGALVPGASQPNLSDRIINPDNPSGLKSGTREWANSVLFGFGPEIGGGVQGALDWAGLGPEGSQGTFSGGYRRFVDQARANVQADWRQNPGSSATGAIAGAVTMAPFLPEIAPLKAAAGASLPARIGVGAVNTALTGGAYGGLYGAGEASGGSLADRASGFLQGAAGGALLGPPLAGLGAVASSVFGRSGAANEIADAAGRLSTATGVPVRFPIGRASESKVLDQINELTGGVPIAGAMVKKAGERAASDMGNAAGSIAAQLGGGAVETPFSAGGAARDALMDFAGPKTEDAINAAYDKVDNLINPNVRTPLNATAQTATDIINQNAASTLGPGKAVGIISQAAADPQGLTYAGIKGLRTHIGEMLNQPTLMPPGTSQTELKRIYGALSEDLGAAAKNAGGDPAFNAWQGANAFTKRVQQRRQDLTDILGAHKDASNEQVFNRIAAAASSGKSGDALLLEKARKSMSPDAWNSVASAVTDGLGKVTNDQGQTTFSIAKYLTNYGKLSDAGKQILYTGRPDLANALDDLKMLAGRFKASARMENVSKTASHLEGGGLMALLLTGHLMSALVPALGAGGASLLLSRPATVRALSNWAKVYGLAAKLPAVTVRSAARRFAAEIGMHLGLGNQIDRIYRGLLATVPGQGGTIANAQNGKLP